MRYCHSNNTAQAKPAKPITINPDGLIRKHSAAVSAAITAQVAECCRTLRMTAAALTAAMPAIKLSTMPQFTSHGTRSLAWNW